MNEDLFTLDDLHTIYPSEFGILWRYSISEGYTNICYESLERYTYIYLNDTIGMSHDILWLLKTDMKRTKIYTLYLGEYVLLETEDFSVMIDHLLKVIRKKFNF